MGCGCEGVGWKWEEGVRGVNTRCEKEVLEGVKWEVGGVKVQARGAYDRADVDSALTPLDEDGSLVKAFPCERSKQQYVGREEKHAQTTAVNTC